MIAVISAVADFIGYCLSWFYGLIQNSLIGYYPFAIVFGFIVLMPIVYGAFRVIRGD